MGFIMDGLDAEAYDRVYTDKILVKRIAQYFRTELPRMLVVAGAVVLISGVDVALPIVVSRSLDQLQKGEGNLLTITLLISIVACLSWFFTMIRQWLSYEAISNVVVKLREDTFDKVIERDLSFYDTFPTGKIVSRITSDTSAFAQVVGLVIDLLSRLMLVAILIVYLFSISVKLTLIMLALAPFIMGVALAFRKIARNWVTQSRRILAEVNNYIQETISGISVAKTFRQEQMIFDEFLKVNDRSYHINVRTGYTFASIFPLLNTIGGIGTASLIYFGGLTAKSGELSAGDWYLFIQAMVIFWFPLTSIASFWSQFQLGLAAGERVFALMDAEPKVVQTDSRKLEYVKGDIHFNQVDFAYNDGEPVLQDFTLHIQAGETLALVGHTGSGKSSITKLVTRFYEFQGGTITVDGQDIRTLSLPEFRANIGFVTQTPFLFDGTVMENIRYGCPAASDEEVISAATHVGGGDWIKSLPQGLQTEVGERGGNLSMGQRQLVSLARVLLQNPSIFILDEATASIDPLTETMIQEGLDTILKYRTAIVVAHRLSTVKNADRIIVLKQGAIIEHGNHDELLAKGGHYAELYNTYFRHQSLEYMENAAFLAASH